MDQKAWVYYHDANGLFKEGRLPDALETLNTAIEELPGQYHLLVLRAFLHRKLLQLNLAKRDLRAAIDIDPMLASAHINLVCISYASRDNGLFERDIFSFIENSHSLNFDKWSLIELIDLSVLFCEEKITNSSIKINSIVNVIRETIFILLRNYSYCDDLLFDKLSHAFNFWTRSTIFLTNLDQRSELRRILQVFRDIMQPVRQEFGDHYRTPLSPGCETKIGGVAVLLAGQIRGWQEAHPSLLRFCEGIENIDFIQATWDKVGLRLPTLEPGTIHHLNRTLPSASVEILGELGEDTGRVVRNMNSFRSVFEMPVDESFCKNAFGVNEASVLNETEFEAKFEHKIERLKALDPEELQHAHHLNAAKMLYINHESYLLLCRHETNRGKAFDYVLRVRPDAVLTHQTNLRALICELEIISGMQGEAIIVDADRCHRGTLTGDQFSLARRKTMATYCDLWSRLDFEVVGDGYLGSLVRSHDRLTDYYVEQDIICRVLRGVVHKLDGFVPVNHSSAGRAMLMDSIDSSFSSEQRAIICRAAKSLIALDEGPSASE